MAKRQTVDEAINLGSKGKVAWEQLIKAVASVEKARNNVYLQIAAVWVACQQDGIWITGKAMAKATRHSEGYVSSIKTGLANYMTKQNVGPEDALKALKDADSAREFLADYTDQKRGGGTSGKGKNTGQGRKDAGMITPDANDENKSIVHAASINQVIDAYRQLKGRLGRLLPNISKNDRDDLELIILETHGMFSDPAFASNKGNGAVKPAQDEQDGAQAATA